MVISKVMIRKSKYGTITIPLQIMDEENISEGDYAVWKKHDQKRRTYIITFTRPEEEF